MHVVLVTVFPCFDWWQMINRVFNRRIVVFILNGRVGKRDRSPLGRHNHPSLPLLWNAVFWTIDVLVIVTVDVVAL